MKTLPTFTPDEFSLARNLLCARVATMMGRKMEEADWDFVYSNAKKIPPSVWSNLHIDVIHNGLGVEHKMIRYGKSGPIKQVCGTSMMHPSATRSIRVSNTNIDPNKAAHDVLTQYGDLIAAREKMVRKSSKTGKSDMRMGWLIWKDLLDEFLYFEVPMEPPTPKSYYAEWNENPPKGARKGTKNLWIYEKETGKKRYSVTTSAGAKIQPYFDIPSPTDPNLYYFKVQGNEVSTGSIELWVTKATAKYIESLIGSLDPEKVSNAILSFNSAKKVENNELIFAEPSDFAIPIIISKQAYQKLQNAFDWISDEYMMQQFALGFIPTK